MDSLADKKVHNISLLYKPTLLSGTAIINCVNETGNISIEYFLRTNFLEHWVHSQRHL